MSATPLPYEGLTPATDAGRFHVAESQSPLCLPDAIGKSDVPNGLSNPPQEQMRPRFFFLKDGDFSSEI
jgi:hypothetical protein